MRRTIITIPLDNEDLGATSSNLSTVAYGSKIVFPAAQTTQLASSEE
jgi:hypothetical protein